MISQPVFNILDAFGFVASQQAMAIKLDLRTSSSNIYS